jgi:hypothetical protein
MKKRRLLRSWTQFDITPESLQEASNASRSEGSSITLKGVLQKADTLNQNGRIYPANILKREIENYQKYILERRSTGELDHPDSSVVSLSNASHLVTKAYMEGKIVYGEIMILRTPSGRILRDLIEDRVKLGISSRGVGSTEKDGDYYVVQDDYQLICWDMVSEPSTPGAFMLPEGRAFWGEGLELSEDYTIDEGYHPAPAQVYTSSVVDEILSLRRK